MMLYEANPLRFYLTRFCLLFVGLALFTLGGYTLIVDGPEGLGLTVFLLILGCLSTVGFLLIKDRLRRVAISRNIIHIDSGEKASEYRWTEVESIRYKWFPGVYELKIKSVEEVICFLPYGNSNIVTDEMNLIIHKAKKDYSL